jgi:hypothetical protein
LLQPVDDWETYNILSSVLKSDMGALWTLNNK